MKKNTSNNIWEGSPVLPCIISNTPLKILFIFRNSFSGSPLQRIPKNSSCIFCGFSTEVSPDKDFYMHFFFRNCSGKSYKNSSTDIYCGISSKIPSMSEDIVIIIFTEIHLQTPSGIPWHFSNFSSFFSLALILEFLQKFPMIFFPGIEEASYKFYFRRNHWKPLRSDL